MASINKLSLRGIRAFSPEDQEQVVEFYFPITVIVGQNGCGKTTIIEALKYAITGSFPPGCGRSGNAFVHDPKSIVQTTVKASVKLRLTSRAGQSIVVIRSMELTQKKTTQTFKQLDGVLRMMDPITGEKVSLSHKCTELDRQLPQLLGVSKPILEHVVFCHQEDASWPLMEGAVLKKRFDDIFDSTKYSKALQAFRTVEKDFLSQVKDLKVEVATYNAHKQAADAFRKELIEQQEHIDSLGDAKEEVEREIANVEATMQRLQEVMNAVEDIDMQIESRKNELTQEKVVISKQRSMLEEDLTRKHSLVELKGMLHDFHEKMNVQVNEQQNLKNQVQRLANDIEQARQDEIDLTGTMGKLIAEKEAHEKHLRQRYRKMEHIAQTYSMDLTQVTLSQGNASVLSQTQGDGDDDNETLASMLSISADDMQGFFQALQSKQMELLENLNESKARYRSEEDKIQAHLTELGGKLQAIENDKVRLSNQRKDIEREMKELKETGGSRIRKVDVEELRRKAARLAEEREDLIKDPRKMEIIKEIRDIEDAMEKMRRKIDDESSVLQSLRHTSDAQNALVALQEQCDKDIDVLDDSIREESYTLNKFEIVSPNQLPRNGDNDGDQLLKIVESMMEKAREKYNTASSQAERSNAEIVDTQKVIAEKSAIISGNQKGLTLLKSRQATLSSSIAKVQKTIEELRRHETTRGYRLEISEDNPRELVKYIDERLDELEEDAPELNAARVAKKVLKRIARKSRAKDPRTGEENLVCPCCQRNMDINETKAFIDAMKKLENDKEIIDTDETAQERYKIFKTAYQSMRKALEGGIDDLRDSRRMTDEASDLEKDIQKRQDELNHHNNTLREQTVARDELQKEVTDLRELVDTLRRWMDDAGRIVEKKLQICQKKLDLQATSSHGSRDLKTVDRQITELREEKEALSNKILRLNKEMSELNQKISEVSSAATKVESMSRDTEEKYSAELKAVERRKDLGIQIQNIAEEEKKLSDQVAPLQQKKKKKESEKDRVRNLGAQEEEGHQSTLNAFKSEVESLQQLTEQIVTFTNSDKSKELEQISSKVASILERAQEKQLERSKLVPKMQALQRAVDDQERHKKMLSQNIDILESSERMQVLEAEILELTAELEKIDGSTTVSTEYKSAKHEKELLQQKKSNYEGRHSSHMDQYYALKRKLSSAEYKEVDEQYRVANIKMITTNLAAQDLKKYGNALDKALLQFHGVKIREINKIIKELWMMTYKGQDITDIEIQSGMEPGSKAAKSYNYRVVMRKGGATMDMRGRCSAGQRVLACIVIRLALAETFGVNCGVVALDEPTVNLDFDNKRGLALALSHIVAARSQQRNFQLIMITHDEEFVGMMKVELSSLTGFSMPERYFQVSREEAADGKFYSKIHAMDWDELVNSSIFRLSILLVVFVQSSKKTTIVGTTSYAINESIL